MSFIISLITLLQIALTIAIDVRNCNDGLLGKNKFTITGALSQEIPLINSSDYWQLKGEDKIVEGELDTPTYLTGFGIRVNTENKSPCNFVESSIDLREFEIIVDKKRVDFPNRKLINKTFIKVSFITTYGSTIQIRKVFNNTEVTDPVVYCIQYELYGCTDRPTGCGPVLSYDSTQPADADSTYTGVCSGKWCSGGIGELIDDNFKNTLKWEGSGQFSISFYQHVGISNILIFLTSVANVSTNSQFPTQNVDQGIKFSLETAVNFIEFEISVDIGESFEIEEILITYWTQNQLTTVSCAKQSTFGNSLPDSTASLIIVGIGLIMFIIGFALPIISWYVRKRAGWLQCTYKPRNIENIQNNERTQHVYTDIRTQASAADTKNAIPVRIEPLAQVEPLSHERNPKLSRQPVSFTDSLEEQVRNRTLERKKRENFNSEDSLEENPIYDKNGTPDPQGKLDRSNSEVFVSENPQYVSTEMMRLHSAGKITPKEPYKNEITVINEDAFNDYDKLDHSGRH
ncbi:hypothetical protein LOD99_14891 [Oopsacas minuta]|uniref:Uncharacterized protein n=1 Tax=Oopsacas minuta TaxID=111878 RepID=A0AAV7KDC6_9METZ|nr:hypothetical protein LOD99_14891 [Oopsacas minuta]